MRILHLADLHGRQPWYHWATAEAHKYAAVVIAGDLIDMLVDNQSVRTQIASVTTWVKAFPAPLFLCTGNHDVISDDDLARTHAGWFEELQAPHLTIDGQSALLDGMKIGCSPWGEVTSNTLAADIVVCHAPPCEAATAIARETGSDWGDFELAENLRSQSPAPWLLLGGHVHRPRNWISRIPHTSGRCWSLNPGHDEKAAVPNHIIIDTDRQVATRVTRGRTTSVTITRGRSK